MLPVMYFPVIFNTFLMVWIIPAYNNREACFIEPENYQFYLDLWKNLSRRYGCVVHAYCLMTNHIHFLVTPSHKTSISNTF